MADTQIRRFCSLDEDLRQRLQAVGIEQRDMRFEPDPRHPSRWVLSWRPPAEPDFELIAQREILRRFTAERERDAARSAERRAIANVDSTIGRELRAIEERDRARASAMEWANTPIHRLLAAYEARRNWSKLRPGDLRSLVIREGDPSWWWIDWDVWTDAFGWRTTRCSADSLDAACTAAAEQIEAA